MGIIITNEEHQYNGELSEGDNITIFINDNPTPVSYTVNTGYKGLVTFMYQESKL